MIGKLLQKIFGTASERAIKKIKPILDEINQIYEGLSNLTDEQLAGKTDEFKKRIAERCSDINNEIISLNDDVQHAENIDERENLLNRIDDLKDDLYNAEREILDELLPEAFAVVKEVCRRLVGKEFTVTGHKLLWDMVPYDVQILGGINLHMGKISEMATGEGKTLVAAMPLYLNALIGKGAHLVTVNDYLAKRDSQWISPIYNFLGLSVGCIDDNLEPHSDERREQYHKDITYGTNNQFGFDYLRDNMASRAIDRVQRDFYYAIIDEVDSVLIDEARTPLIISGPVPSSIDEKYKKWVSPVDILVRKQRNMSNQLVADAEKYLEEGENDKAGEALLMVERTTPKNTRFLKLIKKSGVQQLISKAESIHLRDKTMHELDANLYFAKEERESSINLTDKGSADLSPGDKDMFTLPDLGYEIDKVDRDDSLSEEEKSIQKKKIYETYSERSETLHAISQLLKAYTLFEKDVDYVVKDNKVMIVDEFTGRLMAGRRFSDGLHQALEAKENVAVGKETQTYATITLQNFFRIYKKLAGMTGTALTEANEFWEIYKLDVVSIPTNKPIAREDFEDNVYLSRREKYNAILAEIEKHHSAGRPILVGTVTVEVSETLSRMLKRKGISHSVLNAKHHEQEAEIVSEAGRLNAVTIATNMAGRGTDIKLAPGVKELGGLHIIGSERHDSRRIDNQLRGRAGRQGDPGSSVFFVSMEDDLMRLHAGGERIASVMERVGAPEGEAMVHPLVSSSIEKAQKRVETQNFAIRKHLLEYDDVMNQQRTVIYSKRNEILDTEDLTLKYRELILEFVTGLVEDFTDRNRPPSDWDWSSIHAEFSRVFLTKLDLDNVGEIKNRNIEEVIFEQAWHAFELKKTILGEEIMRGLMNFALIATIDKKWMEHLHAMDTLKEGINLRSYAQKDPLIEYKREGYDIFVEMLADITKDSLLRFFHTQVRFENPHMPRRLQTKHESVSAFDKKALTNNKSDQTPKAQPMKAEEKKVGRNDPCPCGSGKKYKQCCGKDQ